jgi:hypothetical protein
MFMHIGGMGDETRLATAVFAKLKEKGEVPNADIDPARISLDPSRSTWEAFFDGRKVIADHGREGRGRSVREAPLAT